jgi:pyruvate ferredoxin oxidoreductase gamma subunit/2-oxoisovalerate ferredoxin oxidoreductase gamma subunit
MIELRFHGRAAKGRGLQSCQAAFRTGRYVQSYPDYGVERRGAPVVAFARIAEPGDDTFVRQDIREPDHLLILDATLLATAAPLAGLRPGGWVVNHPTRRTARHRPHLPVAGVAPDRFGPWVGAAQPVVNTAIFFMPPPAL